MSKPSIPTLQTARLVLRPFDSGDLDSLTGSIFADAAVTRYLPQADMPARERAERALASNNEHWQQHGFGKWAVTDRSTGEFIGYCGLNYVAEVDAVEIEYGLGHAHWGRGIATEAARAGVCFAFTAAGQERIIGLVVPDNVASRRVLEHLGMAYLRAVRLFGLDLWCYEVRREE